MNFPILHIYAQQLYHSESYIVGNKEGLLKLKEAIDEALKMNDGEQEVSVSDGEGYDVCLMLRDDETIDKLVRPYVDECAKDNRKDAVGPWDLWYNERKKC